MNPGPRKRLLSVDLMRTFSIFCVLLVHLRGTEQALRVRGFLGRVWEHWSRNGSYGVTVFFVISGFLISRMIHARFGRLEDVRFAEFYRRRAARILPLLAVVVATGVALLAAWPPSPARNFVLDAPGSVRDAGFWASIPLFFFNGYRIFADRGFGLHWDVLWSLAIEEQFYLMYPGLLVACAGRRRLVPALLAVWAAGPLARLWLEARHPAQWLPSFTHSLTGFEAIALGCLVFLVHEAGRLRTYARPLRWLGGVSFLVAYAVTELDFSRSQVWGPTWIGLSTAAILLGVLELEWRPHRLGTRVANALARPGRLSYGLYLWHPLAIGLCWPWLARFSFTVDAAVVAAAAWGLAWVSWRGIEEPAYRKLASSDVPSWS